jgi:hypothetical protein
MSNGALQSFGSVPFVTLPFNRVQYQKGDTACGFTISSRGGADA